MSSLGGPLPCGCIPHSPWAVVLSRYIWGWIFTLLGVPSAWEVPTCSIHTSNSRSPQIPRSSYSGWWVSSWQGWASRSPFFFPDGVLHGKVASLAILLAFLLVILNLLADFNPSILLPPSPTFYPY